MAYIPKDANWYIAEMVVEISVEGDPRTVVHRNTVLIRADTPQEAYSKSLELGKEGETSFENPQGSRVNIRFRGLRDLVVVHDRLEHGAELFFEEFIDVPEGQVLSWVRKKEDLTVFRPIKPTQGPDYSSREVMDEALARAKNLR